MSALSHAASMLLVLLILIVAALIVGLVWSVILIRRAHPIRPIREHTDEAYR